MVRYIVVSLVCLFSVNVNGQLLDSTQALLERMDEAALSCRLYWERNFSEAVRRAEQGNTESSNAILQASLDGLSAHYNVLFFAAYK